jgi:2-polyprenyl-3-methyl-5-hydroxy-6-metoxy-1,4-benzoquinol methylase
MGGRVDTLTGRYREMAADEGNFHGLSVLQHKKQIGKILKRHGCVTLLDFGCGRGDAYASPHTVHSEWGIKRKNVTLYDPAFKRYAQLPPIGKQFDAVLCSDVLEHIPEAEVDEFIARLFSYARHTVWASVCCRPAKKTFPGTDENLHVTVKPYQWWLDTFGEPHLNRGLNFTLVETP